MLWIILLIVAVVIIIGMKYVRNEAGIYGLQ